MIETATQPGRRDVPNQDLIITAPGLVVLLDGAGGPSEDGGGCRHGVEWLVRQLGGRLAARALTDDSPLSDILALSIEEVAALHATTCDLRHPGTPSTTVAMARRSGDRVEHLSVHDSSLVFAHDDGTTDVISDRRVEGLPELRELWADMSGSPLGSPAHATARRAYIAAELAYRNSPGGYWVVGADPRAATEAVTGSVTVSGLRSVSAFSDGVADYVDLYALASWPQVIRTLDRTGPLHLIGIVRAAERQDPRGRRWPRFKQHDDASIVHWKLVA
ncbi:protein phosphatase 2C domain-containing protein [Streptomyces sp. NPDC050121]|uniref:protein phosphatase 2C domain-containing protein n=1 Tax=Streptomyces sp. NPDC050121 TaxID=3365601 RepID=UPI0037BC2E94